MSEHGAERRIIQVLKILCQHEERFQKMIRNIKHIIC